MLVATFCQNLPCLRESRSSFAVPLYKDTSVACPAASISPFVDDSSLKMTACCLMHESFLNFVSTRPFQYHIVQMWYHTPGQHGEIGYCYISLYQEPLGWPLCSRFSFSSWCFAFPRTKKYFVSLRSCMMTEQHKQVVVDAVSTAFCTIRRSASAFAWYVSHPWAAKLALSRLMNLCLFVVFESVRPLTYKSCSQQRSHTKQNWVLKKPKLVVNFVPHTKPVGVFAKTK